MSTLVYSPGLRVTIGTARRGIIDVSDDVARGSITLNAARGGQGHTVNLTLTNDRGKYAGVFTPNDRIVVHMKRIRWLQIFSGYLDSVPLFSAYSEDVTLGAQCTLKRLLYSVYDKGSPEVANLLNTTSGDGPISESPDSDLGLKIVTVLQEIVGWERDKIHMGALPVNWMQEINGLYQDLERRGAFTNPPAASGIVGGTSLASIGTTSIKKADGTVDQGPGYGTLPQSSGVGGVFGDSGSPLSLRFSLASYSGPNSAGGSSHGAGDWVCAMRWPYDNDGVLPYQTGYLTNEKQVKAKAWWKARKILVVNSRTQKAIVVQPVHWGPPKSSGRAIDITRNAMNALAGKSGDIFEVRFAPEGAALGVIDAAKYQQGVQAVASVAANAVQNAFAGLMGGSGASADGSAQTVSHDGILWNDRENLSGNTAAARDFIKKNWTGTKGIGGYRSSGSVATSDHPKGLALDVMVSSGEPTNEEVALGNSIAWWFCQNPGAFGTKYVIWNNMIYDAAKGPRPYIRSDGGQSQVTLGHRDHVHISFYDTNQTAIGPAGTPFAVSPSDFFTVAALGGALPNGSKATAIGGPGGVAGGGPSQLITAWNWYHQGDPLSTSLAGSRMLLNDVPVTGLIQQMAGAAMRQYCSAPNGDFIAWFPDYFNLYGVLSRMVLQTIEIQKFNIQWDDRNLITHSFVTGGTPAGYGAPSAQAAFQARQVTTQGIATVEFPEILSTLLNANPKDPASAGWLSPEAILTRFGARVKHEELTWAASPQAEFWAAVHNFRLSWASQFSTAISVSFLPEMFPGMIAQIPAFGIQFYVDSVTHEFDLGPNGSGFSTTIRAIAPSTLGNVPGLYGLPRGGAWVGAQEQGPAYGPVVATGTTGGKKGVQGPIRGVL